MSQTIKETIKLCQGNSVVNYCNYLHIQKTLKIHKETTFLPNNFYNYFWNQPQLQNVDSQNLDLHLLTSVEELD